MGGEDELQIRVGLTIDGVQETERRSTTLVSRATTAKRTVEDVDRGLHRAEHRVEHMQKHILKNLTRFAIGSALGRGVEALTHNDDQNAYSFVRQLATTSTVQSLMLGSLRGGVIVGTIMTAIQALETGIENIKREVEEREKREKETEEKITKFINSVKTNESDRFATNTADIKKLEQRIYNDTRSPF